MKSIKLALVLAVALLTVAGVSAALAGSPVTKDTGKNAAQLAPTSGESYGVYWFDSATAFGGSYLPGASGKVNVVQPNGNVMVNLTVSANGLVPNTVYTVWFDMTPGDWAGPFVDPTGLGFPNSFTTDATGHGEWHINAPAGTEGLAGSYSIWINQANVNDGHFTVLVSDPIEVAYQ